MNGRGMHHGLLLALLAATTPAGAQESEQPRLRHNPFAVPPEFAAPGTVPGIPLSVAPGDLALHAVIPGPRDRALASLNGVILRIGESFRGYELVAVEPDRARFRHEDGRVIELELRALEGRPQQPPETLPAPAPEPAASSEEQSDEEEEPGT